MGQAAETKAEKRRKVRLCRWSSEPETREQRKTRLATRRAGQHNRASDLVLTTRYDRRREIAAREQAWPAIFAAGNKLTLLMPALFVSRAYPYDSNRVRDRAPSRPAGAA